MRVDEKTRATIRQLSKDTGRSMVQVVADAVEAERRRVFMERFNACYARLRARPVEWAEEQAERKLWERTLMDGLEPE